MGSMSEYDRSSEFEKAGLSWEQAKKRSVMICTPAYAGVSTQYTASALATQEYLSGIGIRCTFKWLGGSSVVHAARNSLVNSKFLPSDFTDLLFIDADMSWDAFDVVRLLASDRLLVGGIGRRKIERDEQDQTGWCISFTPEMAQNIRRDHAGMVECAAIGTGFMLINRAVFNLMIKERPDLKRRADMNGGAYFKFFSGADTKDPETGEIDEESEDFAFCRMFRELGGEVWMDPHIKLGHYGMKNFTGDPMKLFEFTKI